MTGQPAPNPRPHGQQEGNKPPGRASHRARRRWPWVLLGTGLVFGGLLAYSPTLFGGLLISRLGSQIGIGTAGVSGPLWSPRLSNTTVTLPGVEARAGTANVRAVSVNPLTRTAHIKVALSNADVKLNLEKLFAGSGKKNGSGGGGAGWNVVVDGVEVKNSHLSVDGQGVNIPNLTAQVGRSADGKVLLHGHTQDGPLSAQLIVGTNRAGSNKFTVNIDSDARVVRHYWKGVEAGRIKGRYVFGDGPVRGDLRVIDATLRVPEARFVTIKHVRGNVTHRDQNIGIQLAGVGWNGPVNAKGGVDLKAKHWTVTANAAPTMSGLAKALGTTGAGDLKLRVTAGGWSTVRVKAYAQGAGTLAGINFDQGKAEYSYLSRDNAGKGQTNTLQFSARTKLAGEQRLAGEWAFGRAGTASWKGHFASRPLDLAARIEASNDISLVGQALGGPARGTVALKNLTIAAILNPDYGAAKARVAVSGTPSDLRAVITNGAAGPFSLSGTAQLNRAGLQADLGTLKLDLDHKFRGRWQARNLKGAGLTLNGAGPLDLTGGDLSGQLQAKVPGLEQPLSGPFQLNYVRQRGTFTPGAQRLTWLGNRYRVQASNLGVVGGVKVSGDVTVDNKLQAFGQMRVRGNGYNLSATAWGSVASLRGTAGNYTVLADTSLRAPYLTTARIPGADISGTFSVQGGVHFVLNTAGERVIGVLDGQNWNATGRVNLAALRPLLPVKDLGGTLDLHLAGLGGTAQVNAVAAGTQITGTLKRVSAAGTGGRLLANLSALLPKVNGERPRAQLAGQVYPGVQASGTVTYRGQTLDAALSGPYDHLAAHLTGHTAPLSFSGVTVPAQAIDVTGTLTPRLTASGRWGDLNASYDGATGLVRVTGAQTLTAFGQTGRVQGRASWGPGFRGMVDARGSLDQYSVAATGPWSRLNVQLGDGEGLRGVGTASLPAGKYNVSLSGPLTVPGQGTLIVNGNIQGTGAHPTGKVYVTDRSGGKASITLDGFDHLSAYAQNLTLGRQKLQGQLNARGGVLTGRLKAGPLDVVAAGGRIRASGEFSGQQIAASGKLTLPATVSDLHIRTSGPYFTASAQGSVANLRGTVRLNAQSFGSGAARVILPAQSFPLSGSLTGARATVGGLSWRSGIWSGELGLRYALQTQLGRQNGHLRLAGNAKTLTAYPTGPLGGQLQVLPSIGGTLSADIAPYLSLLPANLRPLIVPGRLVAQVTATGAHLNLHQTQYLKQPLGLDAQVNWRTPSGQQGVQVRGVLSHPGTRLPVLYDGHNLTLSRAVLDARALQPALPNATGQLRLDLNVPGLNFGQATGRANVNLSVQGQHALGTVTLDAGQLSANLQSDLSGVAVQVRGPVYPNADAVLSARKGADHLSARVTGQAARTLTLRGSGAFGGKALSFTAVGQGLSTANPSARLNAAGAGALAQLSLSKGAGSGLDAWKTSGTLNVSDLKALAGTSGQVSAAIGGSLGYLRVNAVGEAQGIRFSAPATYSGGKVRVTAAHASLKQGDVTATGTVFPALDLRGAADIHGVLPGRYDARVTGTFAHPVLDVRGELADDFSGLQVRGTRLRARLAGKDWKADFSGAKLSGTARGRLGQNAAGEQNAVGGLQNAALTLHTSYVSGTNTVRLDGPFDWNARTGWRGKLHVAGDVPGGPLDAFLTGSGPLHVAGTLGAGRQQAGFTAQLPAGLPLKPAGTVKVTQLDAGAFWGRAGQLRVTGTAQFGGAAWNRVSATFAGHLDDVQGELTSDVQASYVQGSDVQASLRGPRLSAQGQLRDGRYDVTLKSQPVHLARLLPASLAVDALTFGGDVQAQGRLSRGPELLTLSNVNVQAEHKQLGPVTLSGSARYIPAGTGRVEALSADLRGTLRGGTFSAQGVLGTSGVLGMASPGGLNVLVSGVQTQYGDTTSFGRGKVDAALHLSGPVRDPFLSGQINAATEQFKANAVVSGRSSDPTAHAKVELLGQTSGLLYADARHLDLKNGTVQAKVYGTVHSGAGRAQVDLAGTWPRMVGQVRAQVSGLRPPVVLRGGGDGRYTLDAGNLGGGTVNLVQAGSFVPGLSGQLILRPLAAVAGSSGQAEVLANVSGSLSSPQVSGRVTATTASAAGVTLLDTAGAFSLGAQGLSGSLTQAGKTVATLKGQDVALQDLGLSAAGSTVRASGTARLNGVADLALTAVGNVSGNLKATYNAGALGLSGNVASQGLNSVLNLQASQESGWRGTAQVTGGPGGVLSAPANLKVSGPFGSPLVSGNAGLLGATAKIVASSQAVQVRLVDGPGATASGAVELRPDQRGQWQWSGATSLSRPELSLSVTPSGPLAEPQLLLSVRRGEWRASGTASKSSADLAVSDGLKDGTLVWKNQQVRADLPGLDLARLQLGGVNGLVTAQGQLGTSDRSGLVTFTVKNFTSPQELPVVGLKPAGDLSGQLSLDKGLAQVKATAVLNAGTLKLSAAQTQVQGKLLWTGALSGKLTKDRGSVALNVSADAGGLRGGAQIRNFVATAAGRTVTVDGQATLNGQTFRADLSAGQKRATLSAEGGIADVLPALENLVALKPTGEGYSAHALLGDADVAHLNLAPGLKGKVSGEATFNDGGGTFLLKSDSLQLGPKTLPTRVEGTLVGGSWRLRGSLGESDFTAGLSGGAQVFGQANLRALPLGAVVGAVTGTTPGEGVVTGIASFRFPVNDPAAGTATVVAERIRVSTTVQMDAAADASKAAVSQAATGQTVAPQVKAPITEVLTGSGSLDFANHELRNINVQLSGAGTWDIQGQYTRQKVDLNAKFTDTTFTPVLRLIPGLTDLQPSLKGTITLSAAGTYAQPRGLLRAQNLVGSVAGLSLQIPQFAGDLPDSGAFTAGGHILTGGTVGTDGTLNLTGQLTSGKLSGTQVKFRGLLAPQALGALPNTTATLSQDADRWLLDLQSLSSTAATGAGSLELSGALSPKWDLTLSANNYNLPLALIYAKESALSGTLRAVDDGQLIHVGGSADFARLILGRVNAPSTIPAPGAAASGGAAKANSTFVSPLPEQYTTFPKPQIAASDAARTQKPVLPFLERLVLDDISLRAPGGIRVDENLARAEFSTAGLTVSGTVGDPRISGDIISQRGSIFLRENEFKITDGHVKFSGNDLYPTFNLVAQGTVPSSTTNQQVPITLSVSGDFRTEAGQPNVLHLETKLSCSDPSASACVNPSSGAPYGEAELYALVAIGMPDLSTLPNNLTALGTSALQTALNVFVLGEIERTLAKALGVDVLRFSPTLSSDGNLNATFTVGSYLTRDLFLQYQVDLRGNGLVGAKYTTPNNRFTFEASTPFNGLNLQSVRPNISAAYNFNKRTSFSVGIENSATTASTLYKFNVVYRLGAK
ncbi:translocation/assembly module TamB domain-containing protein [Deinococcus sp.]|uniref:translocation/assembly module TamB domain-containing protein n=1 Tax=Deinococcus sp. TaxID=47478 RepID=UPI0025C31B18|nr:translocation/assembly module TamB domain-containing protein [Deinococcus sp.]